MPLMRRVIAILERQQDESGAPVFEIGQAVGFIGELLASAGDRVEAENSFNQGLLLDESHYGAHSAVVGKDLTRYADFLASLHRDAEAEKLRRRAQEIAAKAANPLTAARQPDPCPVPGCNPSL